MSLLKIHLAALETEAVELEGRAEVHAKDGRHETYTILSNRAAGIRRALEVLEPLKTSTPSES